MKDQDRQVVDEYLKAAYRLTKMLPRNSHGGTVRRTAQRIEQALAADQLMVPGVYPDSVKIETKHDERTPWSR
jgi:hypothetical protein